MQAVTRAGCVVAGRYRLLDRVGQGAMGTVWRARDLVLTREVAVKQVRLPEMMTAHERDILRERTLREARVSAKLNHPGVVTVHDVIEADGSPWIVMELVAARSLEQVLAEDGPLPPQQAAGTGAMLLSALASAHAAGIVHRDVKPANVLITRDGRAVLTDFGIATLDGDPGLTQAGMVMGTPGFCAPERIRGEPASPASDLWSLGATLYAAVEGHGPFDGLGSPMAVLASIVHSDPPPPRSAGPLGTVICALLNKNPAQRPDAAHAVQLLTHAIAATGPSAGAGAGASAGTMAPVGDVASAGAMATASVGAATSMGTRPTPPDPDLADATASTWPAGFPGDAGPPVSPPTAPLPPGTGMRLPLGQPTSFPPNPAVSFPPSPAVSLPPGPSMPLPQGPATGDGWHNLAAGPMAAGAANLPWSPDQPPYPGSASPPGWPGYPRPASPPGTPGYLGPASPRRSPPRQRHLGPALVIGAIAIVCAGLLIGVIVSRVMGAASRSPAASGAGGNGTSAAGPGSTPLPTGYRWYSESAATAGAANGFSVAIPDGWQAHQQGTATYLQDPAAGESILVTPAPAGDAGLLRETRLLAHTALSLGSYPGYHRIAVRPFLLHGALAVAWRFGYRQPGAGAMAGLDVVSPFTTSAGLQPYQLMVTAPSARWSAAYAAFLEALHTFSPHP